MRGSMNREAEAPSASGSRRRAGSCPPQGRTPPGPTISSAARNAIRSGLVAASQFRGTELSGWPLAAGLGSNITARIISTDRGNIDLSHRPPGVPGTLQLTVLVPVLLNTPRRTQEDVAGIGTTWTLGDAEISVQPEILSKLKITVDDGETQVASSSSLCDSCGICLQPFQPGENLTALPCATDICPSVWHAECVRKWLCQGQTPTCPLCRSSIETADSSSAQTPSPSFALEVRAALPLSATSGLQAAFSSGRGTSNQLLQQLGQVIIQDILLLTLSQHTGVSGSLSSTASLPHLAGSGLLNGATADASSALADLGGLLLQTLTTNGTLPVTLSAVETWAPGTGSPTHSETRSASENKGRGRGNRSKGRGKGNRSELSQRGAWHRTTPSGAWQHLTEEDIGAPPRWQTRQRHSNTEASSSGSHWRGGPRHDAVEEPAAPSHRRQRYANDYAEASSSSSHWQGRQRHANAEASSSNHWQGRQRHANATEEVSAWGSQRYMQQHHAAPARRSFHQNAKGHGKGASGYGQRSARTWNSWSDWTHWDGAQR